MGVNGLYFLNGTHGGGAKRSGIAFYNNDMGDNNHNTDEQPNKFVYTDDADWIYWESNTKQTAGFDNGTVEWQIGTDAQSKNQEDAVGTASYNGQTFTVRKDNFRHLFTTFEGYDMECVYYAFAG